MPTLRNIVDQRVVTSREEVQNRLNTLEANLHHFINVTEPTLMPRCNPGQIRALGTIETALQNLNTTFGAFQTNPNTWNEPEVRRAIRDIDTILNQLDDIHDNLDPAIQPAFITECEASITALRAAQVAFREGALRGFMRNFARTAMDLVASPVNHVRNHPGAYTTAAGLTGAAAALYVYGGDIKDTITKPFKGSVPSIEAVAGSQYSEAARESSQEIKIRKILDQYSNMGSGDKYDSLFDAIDQAGGAFGNEVLYTKNGDVLTMKAEREDGYNNIHIKFRNKAGQESIYHLFRKGKSGTAGFNQSPIYTYNDSTELDEGAVQNILDQVKTNTTGW